MNKTFQTVDKTLAFVEDWSLFFAVAFALLVAAINIALRKTTHINLYWSDEVVRKAIYFTTYIGASAAIRSRSLIRIDALPQLVPYFKRPLNLLNHVAMICFGLLMVYLGGLLTYEVFQDPFAKTSTLQIREWYFYAVLPVLGVMAVLRSIIVMVEDWREG
jgi:TRAP-type C4-dicarboxylate transport system permease small subunit